MSFGQLPVWYTGNRSLAFDGGDYELPVAATHTLPAMPAVWAPKPDGTPWLWLSQTSTSIGQYRDDTGTQLPLLGAHPSLPNGDMPPNFRQDISPKRAIFLLPNTRECDRFTMIYPIYSAQQNPTENFPDATYLAYTTLQLQTGSNHVVAPAATLPYSTIASADGYLASYAAAAAPTTTTRYFAVLINCPTPVALGGWIHPAYPGGASDSTYWTIGCWTYGGWRPPFESGFAFRSRAILYKTVDGANGTDIVPVAITKGGDEIPNDLFDGKLVVSRSGTKVAWVTTNYSKGGTDVVFIDFSRSYAPFGNNRVRRYSFGLQVSRDPGFATFTDIAFNPLNENIVFVTGGKAAGALPADGLSSLDFTNAFASPNGQPTVTTLSSYANAAKDKLFVGFDKTLYLLGYPSATTSLLRTISYNANGLLERIGNPSVSLPYKLDVPTQVDGEYYNNLRAVTGPRTARVVAPATTVNVTFRGPDVRVIPGIQTVVYSWKLNGIPVSSLKSYSAPYSIGSYPLSLMTTVTRCGKVRSWTTYRTLNVTN